MTQTLFQLNPYPLQFDEIQHSLHELIKADKPLTLDVECRGFNHTTSGIATAAFAWNSKEGLAFPIDRSEEASKIRQEFRLFFENYNNTLIYHNASFDIYIIVYQLFMQHILDIDGMLYGLKVMLKNWDDTMYMAYLSLNSVHRTMIGLKALAKPFMGDYSDGVKEDLSNIDKIPTPELLKYNLDDAKATWYVRDTYYPKMVEDDQLAIYRNIYKPGMANIVQMQLTGMPLDPQKVMQLQATIEPLRQDLMRQLNAMPCVQKFVDEAKQDELIARNSAYKKKVITIDDVNFQFKPSSSVQLQKILYGDQHFCLPVIDRTKKGNPSTDEDALTKIINTISDTEQISFIKVLLDYKSSDKIHNTFLPAMLNSADTNMGYSLLYGKFNSTGTRSGRLSSSNVNLQQIPSTGTMWAKPVKQCFKAPPGKLLCGVDFDALEEKIGALTTRDPNRLAIYEKGLDGHSFRALAYFPEELPGIDPDSVDSINSIQDLFPKIRQKAKAPTFLLQYGGGVKGLERNCGFLPQIAQNIKQRYDKLYIVTLEHTDKKIRQASKDGYVTLAFGLRLRTSMLHKVVYGSHSMPYKAQKEARTLGNALGQSWGLLNVRAATEFMNKVRNGPYANRIQIIAQIHDAIYLLIDDCIDVLMYVNEHLIKAIQWQDDPQIWHPTVKLSGKLAIYYPSWNEEHIIPNNASREEITKIREGLK